MPATSDYGKHILILILRDFYCDKPAFLMSHLSHSSNLATCQAGITAPVVEHLKGRNREFLRNADRLAAIPHAARTVPGEKNTS
jgi:hypothetical protein